MAGEDRPAASAADQPVTRDPESRAGAGSPHCLPAMAPAPSALPPPAVSRQSDPGRCRRNPFLLFASLLDDAFSSRELETARRMTPVHANCSPS